jgi:hypothetical protein
LVQMCVRVVLCVCVCNREATVRVWGCWDGMGESSMIVVHGAGMSACRRQEQEMAYMRCKAVQGGADTRRHSSNISHPQGTTLTLLPSVSMSPTNRSIPFPCNTIKPALPATIGWSTLHAAASVATTAISATTTTATMATATSTAGSTLLCEGNHPDQPKEALAPPNSPVGYTSHLDQTCWPAPFVKTQQTKTAFPIRVGCHVTEILRAAFAG